MIGSGKVKYWDLVYENIKPVSNNIDFSVEEPKYCIAFTQPNKIIHYKYKDSTCVIDKGCDTDIQFNPDTFVIYSDTAVRFLGNLHRIEYHSVNKLILKRKMEGNVFLYYVYQTSYIQDKTVLKCE